MTARSPRWLMSFADLTLLLLAFFVLLHAQANGGAAAASVRAAFGGEAGQAAALDLAAADLFQPGEAVLKAGAAERLRALGARHRLDHMRIAGKGSATRGLRLDAWELTAARLAVIARGLSAGGLDPKAIDLEMPDAATRTGPQRFELSAT